MSEVDLKAWHACGVVCLAILRWGGLGVSIHLGFVTLTEIANFARVDGKDKKFGFTDTTFFILILLASLALWLDKYNLL